MAASNVQLGTIVVTGESQANRPLFGLRETVSYARIHAAGATTLAQALQLAPGVYVRLAAQGVSRIDILGLRTRQIKLLINGVPINSSYDGNFDPNLIPVSQIQRIVVTEGNASVLYGVGGTAGVINIITKQGSPNWKATIAAEGGTGGFRQEVATVSGGGRHWGGFLMLNHNSRDDYPLASSWSATNLQSDGTRENSSLSRNTLYAHVRFNPGPTTRFGLTWTRTEGGYGIPPIAFSNIGDPFAQVPDYERITGLVDNVVQLAASHKFSPAVSLQGWIYGTQEHLNDDRYDSSTYSSISNPSVKGTYLLYRQTRSDGFHIQPTWNVSRRERLSFSADLRKQDWQDRGVIRDLPVTVGASRLLGAVPLKAKNKGGGRGQVFGLQSVNTQRSVRDLALAGEYQQGLTRRLTLGLGVGEYWQRRDVSQDLHASGFVGALHYRTSSRTVWYGSIGRKIQFPTLQELYDPTSGNPNLSAQSAVNYQIGVNHKWANVLTTTTDLFFMNVYGFIEKNQVSNLYQNFNHYRMNGGQLVINYTPVDTLGLRFSYTYLDAVNVEASGVSEELQYRPRARASFLVSYRPISTLHIVASGWLIGQQNYYSHQTPTEQGTLHSYFVANVRVGFKVTNRFSLYAGAWNLFDRNYVQSYGFPAPGRVIFAGFETNL